MKKLYKSQDFKLNSYKDLYKCLYGKSEYLKHLVKKRNESYNIITNQKYEILKEKILRANKFERDYSIFSREKLMLKPIEKEKNNRFYFSPYIKPIFLSSEEVNCPNRYQKKKFDIDDFSLIYKETNSSKYSKSKPIIILNTSSYTKLNEKRKYKGTKTCGNNSDFENSKNESLNCKYNSSNNIFNKSGLSNNNSSFLTCIGNNVIFNKKSN